MQNLISLAKLHESVSGDTDIVDVQVSEVFHFSELLDASIVDISSAFIKKTILMDRN